MEQLITTLNLRSLGDYLGWLGQSTNEVIISGSVYVRDS